MNQAITWLGDFDLHPFDVAPPVRGSFGGVSDEYSITFAAEGVYAIICQAHSEMNGAVWVVSPLIAARAVRASSSGARAAAGEAPPPR